jgi:hypothetical protein
VVKITIRFVCLFCAVSIGTTGALAAEKRIKKGPVTLEPQTPALTCEPSEFRSLVLLNHAPADRSQAALAWLKARATICKSEQLRLVRSNLGQWLGTALTPEIESVTDAVWTAIERKKG